MCTCLWCLRRFLAKKREDDDVKAKKKKKARGGGGGGKGGIESGEKGGIDLKVCIYMFSSDCKRIFIKKIYCEDLFHNCFRNVITFLLLTFSGRSLNCNFGQKAKLLNKIN